MVTYTQTISRANTVYNCNEGCECCGVRPSRRQKRKEKGRKYRKKQRHGRDESAPKVPTSPTSHHPRIPVCALSWPDPCPSERAAVAARRSASSVAVRNQLSRVVVLPPRRRLSHDVQPPPQSGVLSTSIEVLPQFDSVLFVLATSCVEVCLLRVNERDRPSIDSFCISWTPRPFLPCPWSHSASTRSSPLLILFYLHGCYCFRHLTQHLFSCVRHCVHHQRHRIYQLILHGVYPIIAFFSAQMLLNPSARSASLLVRPSHATSPPPADRVWLPAPYPTRPHPQHRHGLRPSFCRSASSRCSASAVYPASDDGCASPGYPAPGCFAFPHFQRFLVRTAIGEPSPPSYVRCYLLGWPLFCPGLLLLAGSGTSSMAELRSATMWNIFCHWAKHSDGHVCAHSLKSQHCSQLWCGMGVLWCRMKIFPWAVQYVTGPSLQHYLTRHAFETERRNSCSRLQSRQKKPMFFATPRVGFAVDVPSVVLHERLTVDLIIV